MPILQTFMFSYFDFESFQINNNNNNNNNLFSFFYNVYDYMTHFDMVRLLMFRVRLIMLICIQLLLSSAVKLPLRKEGVWL